MPPVLAIARNAFLESIRQPVVLFLVLLAGLLLVFTTWNSGYSLGYVTTESAEVQADDKVLLDVGMSTIFVMGAILAGFIATSVISREIENKTVLTVISKPISRVSIIVGKYLGVVATLLVATIVMVCFLMLCIRHGVLSTAADDPRAPVITFGLLSVGISLVLAAWLNYFYGWNFPQTALLTLLPLALIAYGLAVATSNKWEWVHPHEHWKPQILTACLALGMAILVLSAVATAASTRLGQVMTIVVCMGVFVASLLSTFLVGRFVFQNEAVGRIRQIEALDPSKTFTSDHSPLVLTLERPLPRPVEPGQAIFYSPSPNGFPLFSTGNYGSFKGDLQEANQLFANTVPPSIIALSAASDKVTLRTIGNGTLNVTRDPQRSDYLFLAPTRISAGRLAIWGTVPNLQFFWLLDAVSQNRPVPRSYLGLASLYCLVHVTAFLSLAVILFQRRDVA
jgi:ABC-2 type transport system permease protein